MVILQTKPELEKRLETLRVKYKEAVRKHDAFSVKRFEWEGKYVKKMILELTTGTSNPDAPLDLDRIYEVSKLIFI